MVAELPAEKTGFVEFLFFSLQVWLILNQYISEHEKAIKL